MGPSMSGGGAPSRPWIDRRQERKFLLSRAEAERLLAVARARMQPDRTAPAAAAPTHTTYFDTEDRELYKRLECALRVRVREYADGARFLEAKYGDGVERTKLRLPLRGAFAEVWADLVRALPDDVVMTERVRAGELAPCLTTEYARQSLRAPEEGLRVTVDTGLAVSAPSGAHEVAFGERLVAEVKYHRCIPSWLERELSRFEEARGFSKFRWGCAAIEGESGEELSKE
jgi:hypothetical protein